MPARDEMEWPLPPISSKRNGRGFRPLAETAGGIIDPVLRKRAGVTVDLLQSWDEIVRGDLAGMSRPLRIIWPRRAHEDDPFMPGTLVIACEGFAAMRIQHEAGELCDRVNAFFGFAAVARIRIEQKPVTTHVRPRRRNPEVGPAAEEKLRSVTREIDDDGLREALQRLGRSVMASNKGQ